MTPFFISLAVTDVLLLAILAGSGMRYRWWAKVAAIVIVLAINFLAWNSLGSGSGYPAPSTTLPKDAEFVSCLVVEPDIATGQTGVIYLWVIPTTTKHGVFEYRSAAMEPRAYALPYDRSLHKACEGAKKNEAQGVRAGIKRGTGPRRAGNMHGGKWHAYVLPSPHLPRKGGK